MVLVLEGGVFVNDKCPLCKSPTKVEIDSKSLARKVICESCGYENIENIESTVSVNEDPPRDKSQNKKPAFVNRLNVFFFFGILILLLIAVLFTYDLRISAGHRIMFGREEDRFLAKCIFPLIGVSVLSLILVIKNFNHRLKQLEARQADED
tara:strand:- start:95 stop:550 length:456 start_codon:yes stop_codon:yes gene_type:complete